MAIEHILPDVVKNDFEYLTIVSDILDNKEFLKLIDIKHHGFNRFNHVLSVSYVSYLFAKEKNLDFVSLARIGLLHDFFTENSEYKIRVRFKSFFIHPKHAISNSLKYYSLTKKEVNMIKAHMFPFSLTIPTSKEALILMYFDKKIAFSESMGVIRNKVKLINKSVPLLLLFSFASL